MVLWDAAPTALARVRSDLGARPRVLLQVWSFGRLALIKDLEIASQWLQLINNSSLATEQNLSAWLAKIINIWLSGRRSLGAFRSFPDCRKDLPRMNWCVFAEFSMEPAITFSPASRTPVSRLKRR